MKRILFWVIEYIVNAFSFLHQSLMVAQYVLVTCNKSALGCDVKPFKRAVVFEKQKLMVPSMNGAVTYMLAM